MRVAASFLSRLRGLLGTSVQDRGSETLLIVPCRSVHTFCMAYALDIAFIDEVGTVIRTQRNVSPNRFVGGNRRAVAVLERAYLPQAEWYEQGEHILLRTELGCDILLHHHHIAESKKDITMGNAGTKIKTLRESLNLSIDELAQRCSCDVSLIEDLESGKVAPSLAPLVKITRALGVRLGTLMDDDTELGPVVTRSQDADPTVRIRSLETSTDAGRLDFFSLAEGKASRHMEPFLIDVHPISADEHDLSSHEGEELLYVLQGAIEIEYGKDLYVLEEGDSIYYDSIVPHQVRGHKADAKIIGVVYAPQ